MLVAAPVFGGEAVAVVDAAAAGSAHRVPVSTDPSAAGTAAGASKHETALVAPRVGRPTVRRRQRVAYRPKHSTCKCHTPMARHSAQQRRLRKSRNPDALKLKGSALLLPGLPEQPPSRSARAWAAAPGLAAAWAPDRSERTAQRANAQAPRPTLWAPRHESC